VHSAGGCGSSAATIAAIVAIMNTAARYLYLEITAKPRLHRLFRAV
jgi:mevalonate pyrophosphate decarboxylase